MTASGASFLEQAARAEAEGDYEKAEKLYREVLREDPSNISIHARMLDLRSRLGGGQGPVSEEEDNMGLSLHYLYKDLDLGPVPEMFEGRDLRPVFGALLKLPTEAFKRVALDVAVVAGISGDWAFSLETTLKLQSIVGERADLKVWQLRCLIELERYAEVVGLARSAKWEPSVLIHVNYLSGLAFEALGMKDQARSRFEAVAKRDANFRDIAQRMLNY